MHELYALIAELAVLTAQVEAQTNESRVARLNINA